MENRTDGDNHELKDILNLYGELEVDEVQISVNWDHGNDYGLQIRVAPCIEIDKISEGEYEGMNDGEDLIYLEEYPDIEAEDVKDIFFSLGEIKEELANDYSMSWTFSDTYR